MIFLIVFLGWMVFALWFTHWVLDEYPDVAYKAGVKIPFDDRINWLRMTVGPNLMETNFIKRVLE